MTAITATQVNNALKVLYIGQRMQKVMFGSKQRPFFNMLRKNKDFSGRNYPIPVFHEDAAAGRSATFATGQTHSNNPQIAEFAIDVVQNHCVVQISTDALLRLRNDRGSFMKQQVLRIDTAINAMLNDIERQLFRTSDGNIGVIASTTTVASTDMDLTLDADVNNFYVGQEIVFADTITAALRGASIGVATVDRQAVGTDHFTTDANINSVSGATGDLIFTAGDYVSASDRLKISGLSDWLPSSAPGTTAFFGQDRSTDGTRLAGHRLTGSLNDIKKAITDAAASIAVHGGFVDYALMNHTDWANLVDQLESDVLRDPGGKAVAGFQYVEVFGPGGPIQCVPCTFAQKNIVWLLDIATWELVSMGEPARVNDDDGLMANKLGSASGLEVRVDSHVQLACYKPVCNGRLTLS